MKKHLFYSLFFWAILTSSCNNGEKKSTASRDSITSDTCDLVHVNINIDSCKGAGTGNLIIKEEDAKRMIAHFQGNYQTGGMKSVYWIEKCGIESLHNFLLQNSNYDGVWVTFGSEDNEPHNTTIFFVPTIPSTVDNHTAQWASVPSIPLPTACNASVFFSDNPGTKVSNFRSRYRMEGTATEKRGLSKKVWVDKCVIHALDTIIKAYSSTSTPLDGINIYSASYDVSLPVQSRPIGYRDINPSTIILVPTYRCPNVDCENCHFPAWDVNNYLYNKYIAMHGMAAGLPAYNHGELCPNACNPTEQ